MIRWFITLVSTFLLSACFIEQQTPPGDTSLDVHNIDGNHSQLRFNGRWEKGSIAKVSWGGSTLQMNFKGSDVAVDIENLSQVDQWRAIVDGQIGERFSVRLGKHRYPIAHGLAADKTHQLVLMKETSDGQSSIHQLHITGEIAPAPVAPQKLILFFGDSNMNGYSLYSEKDRGDGGSYFAYPAMSARMLNARFSKQSYGSATLTENEGNNVIDFLYSQKRSQSSPHYRDRQKPDVIVINAGANDISRIPKQNQREIIGNRFKRVVSEMRKVYGEQTHIVLYNAYGWDLQEPANYTHEIAAEIGGKLSVLLYPWVWEKWHGSMVEQAGQARLLAAHIRSLDLGFDGREEPEVFDGFGHNGNVANGSFEHKAWGDFSAFGWRYTEDGAERVEANDAADGHFLLRLESGESVHQGMDATGDLEPGPSLGATLHISAKIRSQDPKARAIIKADFEGQALYHRARGVETEINPNGQWQPYETVFQVPAGSWKTYISLESRGGTVDFDEIETRLQ
jgi:lysophospholipase L1-like esterase